MRRLIFRQIVPKGRRHTPAYFKAFWDSMTGNQQADRVQSLCGIALIPSVD